MLPLLDYSTKKEQMLQAYYAQLEPQIEIGSPWEDAHIWAILTGEVEVLIRDTLQLYRDLLRADEFHHYCATTQPYYPYALQEAQFTALFHSLHVLVEKEIALSAQFAQHGEPLKGYVELVECCRAVDVLLADESPIYPTEPFQTLLKQSFDDIKAGRVVEMPQEQG
jgi:hypothetical protein